MNKHYIKIDSNNNIIYGFSDAFEQPMEGDICINENEERQFEINGEVNPQLMNSQYIYLYKHTNNEVVLKTDEEIQQEISNLPIPIVEPTLEERLASAEEMLTMLMGV